MKLQVQHKPSLILWKSTSHVGTSEGITTTVTFKPKEAVEANFRRVWNTPGYQAHLKVKERRSDHGTMIQKDVDVFLK